MEVTLQNYYLASTGMWNIVFQVLIIVYHTLMWRTHNGLVVVTCHLSMLMILLQASLLSTDLVFSSSACSNRVLVSFILCYSFYFHSHKTHSVLFHIQCTCRFAVNIIELDVISILQKLNQNNSTLTGTPEITLLLASNLPGNNYNNNCFRYCTHILIETV